MAANLFHHLLLIVLPTAILCQYPQFGYPSRGYYPYGGNPYNLRGGAGAPRPGSPVKPEDLVEPRGAGGFGYPLPNLVQHDLAGRSGLPFRPAPLAPGTCVCVPKYQCKDGIPNSEKVVEEKADVPLGCCEIFSVNSTSINCGKEGVCCTDPLVVPPAHPYDPRCGIRNPNGINRLMFPFGPPGQAAFGEWPWQSMVFLNRPEGDYFQCGGTLIDKRYVLTVAHCVENLKSEGENGTLKVRVGDWDTQSPGEFLPFQDIPVEDIRIHPDFRSGSLWNDVAVLKLKDDAVLGPNVDTVCLPEPNEVFEEHWCAVTGWGKTTFQGGTYSAVMREIQVPVLDNALCQNRLRTTRLGPYFRLHPGFICAGGAYNGEDACKGDGGGPLVCYRPTGHYALAGLVSWGLDCGLPGVPGVYTRVQKYLDFIKEATDAKKDSKE